MASKKQRTETFTLMMTLHEANALLSLLTLLGSLDMESDNVVRESAGKLRDKILTYSRTFRMHDTDCVSVSFFPSEIVPLLKILVIAVSVMQREVHDFSQMLDRRHIDPRTLKGGT